MEKEDEEPTNDEEEEPTEKDSKATDEETIPRIHPIRIYRDKSGTYQRRTPLRNILIPRISPPPGFSAHPSLPRPWIRQLMILGIEEDRETP